MACFLFLPLNCFAVTKFISVRLLANTSVKTQLVNLSKPNGAEIAKKSGVGSSESGKRVSTGKEVTYPSKAVIFSCLATI